MTTTFGIVPEGFVAMTQQDILSQIEASQLSNISAALDVSSDNPLGQVNGIFSRQLVLCWEILDTVYGALDPDKAANALLTGLCKITGTAREAATYSTVLCNVDVDSGSTLVSGTHFATIGINPTIRFTPLADYVALSSGLHVGVMFRAENTGPIIASAGSLNTIATPVVGWNSVTNPLDAGPGLNADDDAALRVRRAEDIAAAGSTTLDAIVADLERASQNGGTIVGLLPGTKVFENTDPATDVNGRPPGCFEVLLNDGSLPAPGNNDAIAQVIWDSKPVGVRSFGTSVGNAIDALGVAHVVYFSRVEFVPVWLTYALTTDVGYVGDAQVKTDVVLAATAKFTTPGDPVIAIALRAMPLTEPGVTDVSFMSLGFAPGPSAVINLPLTPRQLVIFDTSRIVMV